MDTHFHKVQHSANCFTGKALIILVQEVHRSLMANFYSCKQGFPFCLPDFLLFLISLTRLLFKSPLTPFIVQSLTDDDDIKGERPGGTE